MKWINKPYEDSYITKIPETVTAAESFIDLIDSALKSAFNEKGPASFWLNLREEYPALSTQALKFLIPFVSTYLCEGIFSHLLYIKNKYRNKLEVGNDSRLKVSSIHPNIDALVQTKQVQPSH